MRHLVWHWCAIERHLISNFSIIFNQRLELGLLRVNPCIQQLAWYSKNPCWYFFVFTLRANKALWEEERNWSRKVPKIGNLSTSAVQERNYTLFHTETMPKHTTRELGFLLVIICFHLHSFRFFCPNPFATRRREKKLLCWYYVRRTYYTHHSCALSVSLNRRTANYNLCFRILWRN